MMRLFLTCSAPEIANAEAYEASVDMWSVGVILYTMCVATVMALSWRCCWEKNCVASLLCSYAHYSLAGFPPFYAEEDSDLLEKIAEGAFSFPDPWWSTVSDAGTSAPWREWQEVATGFIDSGDGDDRGMSEGGAASAMGCR